MRVRRRGIRIGVACVLLGAAALSARAASTDVEPGKGVTFSSDDGETKINVGFWGQFRFSVVDKDEYRRSNLLETAPPYSIENIGATVPTFSIPRVRLYAKGSVWKSWIGYKVELDFASNDEGLRKVFVPPVIFVPPYLTFNGVDARAGDEDKDGRTVKMLDYYLDLAPRPYARVRIGAFKVPFGRQELVSDEKLQTITKSFASEYFAPKRDRGVMFHGGSQTQRIQYKLGVFNGTGLDQGVNLDRALGYAARLTATSAGPFLDIESMVDAPPSLSAVRLQGGVAWYRTTNTPKRQDPNEPVDADVRDQRLEADLGLFFKRASLFLDYFTRSVSVDYALDLRSSCYGAWVQNRFSCDQTGWAVQSGVLVKDNHEIAARFSMVDLDKDVQQDERKEATLQYTYFYRKHNLKIAAAATWFRLGVNGAGSSGFNVKINNQPQVTFFDPAAFPGLDDDNGVQATAQLQWSF